MNFERPSKIFPEITAPLDFAGEISPEVKQTPLHHIFQRGGGQSSGPDQSVKYLPRQARKKVKGTIKITDGRRKNPTESNNKSPRQISTFQVEHAVYPPGEDEPIPDIDTQLDSQEQQYEEE